VISAASWCNGSMCSREVRLEFSLFQGPGESPDMRGEGRGVTSAIAFNIGEESAEFGAEALLPTLLASTFFMLGVRARDAPVGLEGIREGSGDSRSVFPVKVLADVIVQPGIRSVCIRRPALKGLEVWLLDVVSIGWRRVGDVSSAEGVESAAIEVDLL
jgi:hypothetical protein